MKKSAFILACISIFLISCNSDDTYNGVSNYDDQLNLPTTWQEQLKSAQNRSNVETRNGANEIKLIGYTHKGIIDSENEISVIMEHLFSNNASIVQYTNKDEFEILPLKAVRENAIQSIGIDPTERLIPQLKTKILVGMEIIELEWNYKGNIYYSTAIASNEHGGILYDHIGYMILNPRSFSQIDQEISTPEVKTRSESIARTTCVFSKGWPVYNLYYIKVMGFSLKCVSTFRNGILVDRSCNSSSWADSGFTCEADIKTVGGDLDSSRYHEFAWAYCYGIGWSASISFQGVGFNVSGGDQREAGTEVHRP
ncbi:hypothetical protein [Bacteroides sp. 224]|uniref:hypothetical protein n=1 Tax=Bacteroides sp. 224 TaxID=2302936 RepID=UPI0013D19850|nr:hypothetical protein [Bacteroides sp. 224]NDV65499.1 hypothetical protein [Bacteroides sp. 224]